MNIALAAESSPVVDGVGNQAATKAAGIERPAGNKGADDRGYYLFTLAAAMRREYLAVYDKGGGGVISKPNLASPAFWSPQASLYAPSQYFEGSSHFGYNFYATYYRGYIDRQIAQGAGNVVGTFPRINVTQLDAGVSVFATLGDTMLKDPLHGRQLKFGAGIGPGYLKIDGSVPAQFMTTGVAENIHSGGFGFSINVFVRGTVDGFFVELNSTALRGQANYSVDDANLLIGYTFPFRF